MLVTDAFTLSDETRGCRRVHAPLARWGVPCGPEPVRGVMREPGPRPRRPRPWRAGLTERDGREHHLPDLVGRDLTAEAPGRKLVGDITCIPTGEGWLYSATVIDCCTRMVIGYAMGEDDRTPLVQAALRRAARNVTLDADAVFHSDRGGDDTSYELAGTVRGLGLRQSVGRTGICDDDAMAESFFAALRNERVHRTAYPTRAHARADVARHVEFWYNPNRLHSGLGYTSPQETLDEWTNSQEAA